ncbi:DMT family transporter [Micromonospora sp. NPDC048830]|uniref:DMT family transporter n=1 Tax=Micromonospora sp. NPDC048830 TaxID=3364257 RepID=UPI00371C2406
MTTWSFGVPRAAGRLGNYPLWWGVWWRRRLAGPSREAPASVVDGASAGTVHPGAAGVGPWRIDVMAYLFLLAAIASEVVGTSLLKATHGFTRPWPTLGLAVAYLTAFGLLALAVRDIPVGVAYAMWSGLGTAAIVAIGAAFLGEPLSVAKVVGVGLVIAGVVVLNLGGAH